MKVSSKISESESQASKRRKVIDKTVVTVKIGENVGNLKNEGLPSDLWSWRKYGQKPIKGSPYPRSYYRCSTAKGCSAKKQVERCRTGASRIIITYNSSHNHPNPNDNDNRTSNYLHTQTKPITQESQDRLEEQEHGENQEQEQNHCKLIMSSTRESEDTSNEKDYHFHYLQNCAQENTVINQEDDHRLFINETEKGFLYNTEEQPVISSCSSHIISFSSTPKSSELENDFFDELEELPSSYRFHKVLEKR